MNVTIMTFCNNVFLDFNYKLSVVPVFYLCARVFFESVNIKKLTQITRNLLQGHQFLVRSSERKQKDPTGPLNIHHPPFSIQLKAAIQQYS